MTTARRTLADLRSTRELRGLTRQELAAQVPCSVAAIAIWERNNRAPATTALRRAYLGALGLPIDR